MLYCNNGIESLSKLKHEIFCPRSSSLLLQEIVEDERSDREETDDSEEEDEERNGKIKKNGTLWNGYTTHNNNHRKTH